MNEPQVSSTTDDESIRGELETLHKELADLATAADELIQRVDPALRPSEGPDAPIATVEGRVGADVSLLRSGIECARTQVREIRARISLIFARLDI